MSPTTWIELLYELALVVWLVAMLLTIALLLALGEIEPHGRSRDARRWGGMSASLFALAFGVIGKHIPQGLVREAFDFLIAAGFPFGFLFGVLLWHLLQGRHHTQGSSNDRWRDRERAGDGPSRWAAANDPSATVKLPKSSHSEWRERTFLVCFTEDYW
jgi:peptidoglycan/LPS O-acetylase OafA/YrhL